MITPVAGTDNPNQGRQKLNDNDAFLNAETIPVAAARDLANTDANNVLLAGGTFDLTLPSTLDDDTLVMVIVTSGAVGIVAGAGSTLDGGDFSLDATNGLAAATLLHTTGGQWYALWSPPAAARSTVVASGGGLTPDQSHDNAIIEVADGDIITLDVAGLTAGWSCTIVRTGATSATIGKAVGTNLYGPGGLANTFTIDNQWEAAAVYFRGGTSFVVIGPVTGA